MTGTNRSSKSARDKGKHTTRDGDGNIYGTLAELTDFSQYRMPQDPEAPRPHNSGGSSETTGEYRKIPHIRKDKDKATRVRQISTLDSSGNSANNSSENSANNSSGNSAINSSENSANNSSGNSAINSSENSANNSSGNSAANSSGNSAANSSGNSAANSSGNSPARSGENSATGSGGNSATGSSGNSTSNSAEQISLNRFTSSNQSSGHGSDSGNIASHGSDNSSGGVYGLTDSSENSESGTGVLKKGLGLQIRKEKDFRHQLKFSYSEGFLRELKDKVEFVEFTRYRYKSCPEIPLINLTTKEGSRFCIVNTVNLGMCIVGTQHNQFDVIRCNSTSSDYYSSRRNSSDQSGFKPAGPKNLGKNVRSGSESSSVNYRHVLSQASIGTSLDSRDSKEGSNGSLKDKGLAQLTLNPERETMRARPVIHFSSSSDFEEESLGPVSPAPSLLHDAISAVYEKHPDKFYESMHALLQDVSPSYSEQFCSELTRRLCRVQDERGEPRAYID